MSKQIVPILMRLIPACKVRQAETIICLIHGHVTKLKASDISKVRIRVIETHCPNLSALLKTGKYILFGRIPVQIRDEHLINL